MTKSTKWPCAPNEDSRSAWASAQSGQSPLVAWRNIGPLTTYWDSDQTSTGRMPRLIWVFAGRTCHRAAVQIFLRTNLELCRVLLEVAGLFKTVGNLTRKGVLRLAKADCIEHRLVFHTGWAAILNGCRQSMNGISNSARLSRYVDKTFFFFNRKKVLKVLMSIKWVLDMFKDVSWLLCFN